MLIRVEVKPARQPTNAKLAYVCGFVRNRTGAGLFRFYLRGRVADLSFADAGGLPATYVHFSTVVFRSRP
jgi:hypothetical protein